MNLDCPHCGVSLKRKLIRSVPASGQRKFLPLKAVMVCHDCKGKIAENPHPMDKVLLWAMCLPGVLFFIAKDLFHSRTAMLWVLVCWIVVFPVSWICASRYYARMGVDLQNWPRFRCYEEPQGTEARKGD